MTTSETTLTTGPATLVECPWCEAPVELGRGADEIDCPTCLVTVELAPATAGPRTPRAFASAA